jgi:hypothetical protein
MTCSTNGTLPETSHISIFRQLRKCPNLFKPFSTDWYIENLCLKQGICGPKFPPKVVSLHSVRCVLKREKVLLLFITNYHSVPSQYKNIQFPNQCHWISMKSGSPVNTIQVSENAHSWPSVPCYFVAGIQNSTEISLF